MVIFIIMYGKMEIIISVKEKIIINMDYLKVREYAYIIMEIYMKEILRMEKNMEKENSLGLMALLIMVIFIRMIYMDMEYMNGLIIENMKVIGKIIN